MFTSIRLTKFRGLAELDVKNLSRFNLLTGLNGAGKTSFLEAVFLIAGANPSIIVSLNAWRGVKNFSSKTDSVFKYYFHNSNIEKAAIIQGKGRFKSDKRKISIIRKLEITAIKDIDESQQTLDFDPFCAGLSLKFFATETKPTTSTVRFKRDTDESSGSPLIFNYVKSQSAIHGRFISPRNQDTLHEMVSHISALAISKQLQPIIKALQIIDKRLQDIKVLDQGGFASIFVDIGLDKLMPLTYMGDGFKNILQLSLGSYLSKDGILLIDEIEDGLHHSVTENFIGFLLHISKQNNNQIFATTHSGEVVTAFMKIAQENNHTDTSILRFINTPDNKKICNTYIFEDFNDIEKMSLEVR